MALLTSETVFSDAKDLPSPGWLTALGIVFLFAAIFQELVGVRIDDPIELVGRGADFLSIIFAL